MTKPQDTTTPPAAAPDGPVSVPLGVVVERRKINNPWREYDWRPASVMPGAAEGVRWRLLRDDGEQALFWAATLPLELFTRETDGYRVNLSNNPPMVYVVLRPGEDYGDEDVEPFLVTACPYEAESYAESGDEIVEGVPMPPEVLAMVSTFVERHHVEVAFKKRKRKPFDPRKGEGGAEAKIVGNVWQPGSTRNRDEDEGSDT